MSTTLSHSLTLYLSAGNGPSAIFLSLMLSGFTPCYNGAHPNPCLSAKLGEKPSLSLVDQVCPKHSGEGFTIVDSMLRVVVLF